MKLFYRFLFLLTTLSLSLGVIYSCLSSYKNQGKSLSKEEEQEGKYSKAYMLEEMYKQWHEMMKDPATGEVPIERLYAAWEETKRREQLQARVNGALSGVNWINRGPSNVGGRTRAIMVSPNDATGNTVFAGSVGGGIWKSTNMKSGSPTWSAVNNFMTNLAISSLAYDPTATGTFYAGTGEGYNNLDAARGFGIAKSVDSGNTWTFLPNTQNSNFYYVNKIAVNSSGHIYAATSTGIRRSIDGGTTWTQVLAGNFGDIEIAGNNNYYAGTTTGTATSGAYKSTTGNSGSWSQLTSGISAGVSYRCEIASAPSDSNTVYVMQYEDTSTYSSGGSNYNRKIVIYRSTNGGTSFIRVGRPADGDTGIPGPDFTRAQGWYDLILKVDPNNSQSVYAGGVDIFKSTNGGNAWTQVTHWYGGFGAQYAHADQHSMAFEGTNSDVMYFTNDGGIFQTTNGSAAIPTLTARNTNYAVTQFYACDLHPAAASNYFIAGAQDNGSQKFTTAGFGATTSASGGDGAYCNIDQLDPTYQFTQYVYNNYYRSTDGGASFNGVANGFSSTGRFINPSEYDDNTKALYAATSAGMYLRWSNANSGTTFTQITVTGMPGTVSAITRSKMVADKVYFGTGSGQIVEVSNASTTGSPVAGRSLGTPVAAYLNNIWEDTTNADHLIVVYSSYGVSNIWETFNASAGTPTWTAKDGNLPDMPVYWVLPSPVNPNTEVLVATELGVYSTDNFNNASPTWGPSNTGLANCRVTQLRLRASDKMIVASTHGRGLFTSDLFMAPAADFTISAKVSYIGVNIQFTDYSSHATSWQWDFNGDNVFDNTSQSPTFSYLTPGQYNVKLRINGNASLEKIIPITILPNRGTPYNTANGGDFEVNPIDFAEDHIGATLFSRGNSAQTGKSGTHGGSNAWVIDINSANYSDNSEAYLYTPNFNCTAAGTYSVTFWAKYDVENTWDGFRVEYSLNKGSTWNLLGNVVQSNWYDYANNNTDRPFPFGEAFFTNLDKASYTGCAYSTTVFQGNPNVCFRIAFKSDGAVTAPGVAIDDFTLTGPANAALPVQLISFTGVNNGNSNVLQWKTATEYNSNRFELERSFDAVNFNMIGSVPSRNSASGSTYQYNDNIGRLGVNNFYYRLKMVDNNGGYTYSNIVNLRIPGKNETITLLNNHTATSIKIMIPAALLNGASVDASIISQSGAVMKLISLNSTQNEIDVSRFAAGVYYIRFSRKGKLISTERFIKE